MTALRGRDSLSLDGGAYVCVSGVRVDFPDGVDLSHRDDVTTLSAGGGEQNLERYPLIQADGSLLLQRSCSLNGTADGSICRLDYYTEIRNGGNGVTISRRGKEKAGAAGFVYDNEDTYIFLEPVTLSWGERTMELPALTVAQVTYLQSIQIYGPDTETFYEPLTEEEVTAVFADGRRCNLALDRLYQVNGTWRLLFLPLEDLPDMTSAAE